MHNLYGKICMMYVWRMISSQMFWGWIRNPCNCSLPNPRIQIWGLFHASVLVQKQSSDFCENIIYNFKVWIRAIIYCIKWLKLDVLDVIWHKNAIGHFLPFSHHLCYAGCNQLHALFELFFTFLSYLLRHFSMLEHIVVVFPCVWSIVPGLANS